MRCEMLPHTLVLLQYCYWCMGSWLLEKWSHQNCCRVLFLIFLCCLFQGKNLSRLLSVGYIIYSKRVKWAIVISFRSWLSFVIVDVYEILHFNLPPSQLVPKLTGMYIVNFRNLCTHDRFTRTSCACKSPNKKWYNIYM